jgi:hypothetical protein
MAEHIPPAHTAKQNADAQAAGRAEPEGGAGDSYGALLNARSEVRALGEAGRMLNRRPALTAQRKAAETLSEGRAGATPPPAPAASGGSRTGLPGGLKAGVESLSGLSMDDVKVHYGSGAPARLGAAAYAEGSDIHVGPGQETHLAHEAWHVVQQKQGRVKPTVQMKGAAVNDSAALEREADLYGAKALAAGAGAPAQGGTRRRAPIRATGPKQLKKIPAQSGATLTAGDNQVYFQDGQATVGDFWQLALGERADRVALLKALAAKASTVGAKVDSVVAGKWNRFSESAETDVDYFDPVRVQLKGRYKIAQTSHDLDLDYHFGQVWSGYVLHVRDTGKHLDHEMREVAIGGEEEGEYSNQHAIAPAPARALAAEADADSVTKIAGEGARWKAIAAHAGSVRDTSKIFTNDHAGDAMTSDVRYVTFPTLWKSWAATFGKAYGIADSVVAEALTGANIQTGTGENIVNVAVRTAAASTMRIGTDVPVDDPAPASTEDLAQRNVAFVRYKKNDPSVVVSRRNLTEELGAARAAVAAQAAHKGLEGYLGADVFGFLCTWKGDANPAAVAGYTQQAVVGGTYSYPAYREPLVVELAKKQAAVPDVGESKKTFKSERKARHEAKAAELIQALAAHIHTKQIADLDARLVVEREYPWDADEPVSQDLLDGLDEQGLTALAKRYTDSREDRREFELNKRMQPFARLKDKAKRDKKRDLKKDVVRDVK